MGYTEQYELACVNTRFLSIFPSYHAFYVLLPITNDFTILEQFKIYENICSEPMTFLN